MLLLGFYSPQGPSGNVSGIMRSSAFANEPRANRRYRRYRRIRLRAEVRGYSMPPVRRRQLVSPKSLRRFALLAFPVVAVHLLLGWVLTSATPAPKSPMPELALQLAHPLPPAPPPPQPPKVEPPKPLPTKAMAPKPPPPPPLEPPPVAAAPEIPPAPPTPPPPAPLVEHVSEARGSAGYLNNPPPQYPQFAARQGWQGTVLLRVLVRANGAPETVEIERSSGYKLLDDTALRTVQAWLFVPAKRGETPIDGWATVPIEFKLRT
jgi:protein TonB